MSDANHDFRQLMQQVEEGSDDAARELLDRYGSHIIRAIRAKLHREMRAKFDSEDFYQTVWKSFFSHDVPEFRDEGELIAFLRKVAVNKVAERFRQLFQTQKYNVTRERQTDFSDEEAGPPVKSRDPTPSQIVSAEEQLDRMAGGQPVYRRILELKAGGATLHEIAEDTGLNEKTVRRVIKRIGDRFDLGTR